jgi:hypothetical protein
LKDEVLLLLQQLCYLLMLHHEYLLQIHPHNKQEFLSVVMDAHRGGKALAAAEG